MSYDGFKCPKQPCALSCCVCVLYAVDALNKLRKSYKRWTEPPVHPSSKQCDLRGRVKDSKRDLKNAEVAELKASLLLAAQRQSGASAENVAVAEALLAEMRKLVASRQQERDALCYQWELHCRQRDSLSAKGKA